MSNAHLNAVFDNWSAMQSVADNLSRMATAFSITGNKIVADNLYKQADTIMHWAELLRDTHGEKQSEDLAFSQQATANILAAFVGGAKLAKETNQ